MYAYAFVEGVRRGCDRHRNAVMPVSHADVSYDKRFIVWLESAFFRKDQVFNTDPGKHRVFGCRKTVYCGTVVAELL